MMLAMTSYLLIKMIVVLTKRWSFQFNRRLQADLNHPWQLVPWQNGSGQPRHSEQVSGSEGSLVPRLTWMSSRLGNLTTLKVVTLHNIKDPHVPKTLAACHHGKAEPPHHRLLAQGRLCQLRALASPDVWPLLDQVMMIMIHDGEHDGNNNKVNTLRGSPQSLSYF